ncbi:sortase (surface protein transpeptidase) [Kitasatospora sp. MAP12-15]|uniref:class F sortase n=1 Tax=unclassified Kitasatospora TaxID=2633591 RepID=UPI0024749C24|nr:class F sortase [Kitasatospora sp. MAP12-44]MDH6109494.1 sortase (surface protein transpeptidase) [Kitasatospora sp. MAP12-44]
MGKQTPAPDGSTGPQAAPPATPPAMFPAMPTAAPLVAAPAASPDPMSRRRRRVLYGAVGACVLGSFMIHQSLGNATVLPQRPVAAPGPATVPGSLASSAAGSAKPVVKARTAPDAHPVRLTIPQIGVNAPFTSLDLGRDGTLNAPPPDNINLVGWYRGGTVPGNRGPALVLGHVDTKTSPAVFWNLSALPKGSKVDITRDDGITAEFTVDSAEAFSKTDFPDNRVYGPTPDAQLRLITCGGSYDRKKKDYTANVVVFAHLTALRAT